MADEPARLPQAPASLLDLLRRAEAQLDDLDALREEIRSVREALEAEPEPTVEAVAGALLSGSATLSATATISASGTVTVTSGATGDAEVIPRGSGSGSVKRTGTATGVAPPVTDPASREYLNKVRKVGMTGVRVADFIVRVASLAEKIING